MRVKRIILSAITLGFFAFSFSSFAFTQPSNAEVKKQLINMLPSYCEIIAFDVKASENLGTKVFPDWKFRFVATWAYKENIYIPIAKTAKGQLVQLIRTKGTGDTIFGIASATLLKEEWVYRFEAEGDQLKNVTIPGAKMFGEFVGETILMKSKIHVLIETSKGNLGIELFFDKAPITATNFLTYVESKFYDGLIFHRVIPGFMIQTGGMTAEISQRSGNPPIKNEASNGLKNDRGTLAMARTNVVDSATSQFFINLVNNDSLNYRGNAPDQFGYCVFGKVVSGMDVVDAIAQVPTGSQRGHANVPLEPVAILSATVVAAK